MKLKIITIGEPKLSFAKDGFSEYIKRLGRYHNVQFHHLKDGVEDKKILDIMDNVFCIVLDENGKEFSSRELAQFLDKKTIEGISEICFLVGGPEGHSEKIKNEADLIWSFGHMTFPHDLAMVVLAEALYRASTINVNHPYHRD